MQKAKSRILETTYIALFAALIAVCAFITIPMPLPFISFTLQTFGVFAALGILGGRDGTTAVAVYILLGAIGVPVFSGFRGGFGVLIGPTGGYIAGFLGAALVYWLMTARKNTTARKIAGMAVGAKGVISVLSNVRPKLTLQMVRACQTGEFAQAGRMQTALMGLIDALFCEVNPIPVKQALTLEGVSAGLPRLPLTPLSGSHLPVLEQMLSAMPEP